MIIRSAHPRLWRAIVVLMVASGTLSACSQETDTTIDVSPNAHIQIQNFAGSIRVHGWDRSAVRIAAGQSRENEVRVVTRGSGVAITTVGKSGVPGPLDYELSVPVGAALEIVGTYTAIEIDGVHGPVSAATVQGDVRLRGGSGVSLKSVEGTVVVEDATGRVEVNGVNKGLVLRNVDGEIAAETVNGSIEMTGIRSSAVDAETVNGSVTYVGTIRDRGHYRFGSHTGTVAVAIPASTNATVAATTYQGRLTSRLPMPNVVADSGPGPRRHAFTVGDGSARIEAESFQGDVVLARPDDAAMRPR